MKGKIMWAAVAASAVLLMGCSRDRNGSIPGSYTYKTSGVLTLLSSDLAEMDEEQLDSLRKEGVNTDPLTYELSPEQGQMHILKDDENLVITFNNIMGNADVTTATLEKGILTLSGADTKSIQISDGALRTWSGRVLYGGSGKKYDDMLIIDMEYTGQFMIAGTDMTVISSEVKCVAQSNE